MLLDETMLQPHHSAAVSNLSPSKYLCIADVENWGEVAMLSKDSSQT